MQPLPKPGQHLNLRPPDYLVIGAVTGAVVTVAFPQGIGRPIADRVDPSRSGLVPLGPQPERVLIDGDDVVRRVAVGRRVRTGSLAQTQTYTYDDMDRLKSVCFQTGTCRGGSDPFIHWSYDGVGNRLTEARPTGATSSTYNAGERAHPSRRDHVHLCPERKRALCWLAHLRLRSRQPPEADDPSGTRRPPTPTTGTASACRPRPAPGPRRR